MALVELNSGVIEQSLAGNDQLTVLQDEFSASIGVFLVKHSDGRQVRLLLLKIGNEFFVLFARFVRVFFRFFLFFDTRLKEVVLPKVFK